MPDHYLSEDAVKPHRFMVLIYVGGGFLVRHVEANDYADAVIQVSPGLDAVKIEVFSI